MHCRAVLSEVIQGWLVSQFGTEALSTRPFSDIVMIIESVQIKPKEVQQ